MIPGRKGLWGDHMESLGERGVGGRIIKFGEVKGNQGRA